MNDQFIQIIAVPFLGIEMMGIFSLGIKLSTIISTITSSVTVVFVPKVSKTKKEKLKILLKQIVPQLFTLLSIIFVLGIFIMPFFIYFAYGQLFMRSFWVFVMRVTSDDNQNKHQLKNLFMKFCASYGNVKKEHLFIEFLKVAQECALMDCFN